MSSSNKPFLPLLVQSDIEQQQSWEGISKPNDFARYLARVLAVDPNILSSFDEITYSNIQPSGEEENSIWMKTEEPYAIGIPSSDGYKMFYQYPVNIPYLFIGRVEKIPDFARALTTSELTAYHLTAPSSNTASWVIIPL